MQPECGSARCRSGSRTSWSDEGSRAPVCCAWLPPLRTDDLARRCDCESSTKSAVWDDRLPVMVGRRPVGHDDPDLRLPVRCARLAGRLVNGRPRCRLRWPRRLSNSAQPVASHHEVFTITRMSCNHMSFGDRAPRREITVFEKPKLDRSEKASSKLATKRDRRTGRPSAEQYGPDVYGAFWQARAGILKPTSAKAETEIIESPKT